MRWIAIALITTVFIGCKKEVKDDTAPAITNFLVEGDTTFMVMAPAMVNFTYTITDNEQLETYRFSIDDEFSNLELSGSSNYSWFTTGDLAGTSVSSGITVALNDSVTAGPYTASLDVIDGAFNPSDQETVELYIQNIGMPSVDLITYSNPINAGDTIFLLGNIYDAVNLDGVNITLYDPEGGKEYSSTYLYSDTTILDWNMNTIEADNSWIIVDAAAPAGTYTLHIEGKDTEANFDVLEHEITVN